MAVYTKVTPEQATAFLQNFSVGAFETLTPIREGVENTNYFLNAGKTRYVLTLFEKRVREQDLPYYLTLKTRLAEKNFPCPHPLADRNGETAHRLNDKPAALVSFLPGKGADTPNAAQCHQAGATLAKLHLLTEDFKQDRENALSYQGCSELYQKIAARLPELGAAATDFVAETLREFQAAQQFDLPKGHIHADYFPDNVLFDGDALTGVIDFYFACRDYYIYDLAIAFSAWCFAKDGSYRAECGAAFLTGYASVRKPSEAEIEAFPIFSRCATVRFFLTRSHDLFFHDENDFVTPKDPAEYLKIYQNWTDKNFNPLKNSI